MSGTPASLRALLEKVIDYAGFFPPAALPLQEVMARYERYRTSPDSWILSRLVLPVEVLSEAHFGQDWRVSLLVEQETGPFPPQVETLETKTGHHLPLPTYIEGPVEQIHEDFAKVRTGGLTPEAIPSPERIAGFLHTAAARRLAFKATAGLHHPIRSLQSDPRALMHGFVNVFLAAAFAWNGAARETLEAVLSETDPGAFEFREDAARWRDLSISTSDLAVSRRDFAHSFGSCSFEEPLADLRELGWLV